MRRLFQILTLLALAVVLYFSLRPGVSVGDIPNADKVMHLLAYGLIGGLARLGWPKAWGGSIILIVAGIGVLIEFAQHFMNLGRTGSIADAMANTAGVLLAVLIFHFIRRKRHI